MTKAYKLAVFDLDGTLLDTLEDLKNSTNAALAHMGYPARTLDEVRRFVGNGIRKLMERAVPTGTSSENTEKALDFFKKHYGEHCEDKTKPYDGILPMLDAILAKNIKIAVVSNKIDFAVKHLCEKYFGDRVTISIGDRDGFKKKPDPYSVNEVLKQLDINREDAVYIGDSEVDVMTTRNADMDGITVTWGFRDMKTLADAWKISAADIQPCRVFSVQNHTAYFAKTPSDIEKILCI